MAKTSQINIETTQDVSPKIYAYTTPEISRHDGWTKIGYTEQEVHTRIKQQTHTADVEYKLQWALDAVYERSHKIFTDHMFRAYLRKDGYKQKAGTEWVQITPNEAKYKLYDFREDEGLFKQKEEVIPYQLRKEQEEAVSMTLAYFASHKHSDFLWNAKPRFGKTLSAYDLCKRMDAAKILIITNRPAVANSWYTDYVKFIGQQSNYYFVSNNDSLQSEKYVLPREEYTNKLAHLAPEEADKVRFIEFVSLQDLKGSVYFGGSFDKLRDIQDTPWDILIIDEAHEAIDTRKTDLAFNNIKRGQTLHLSGTPFKALANDKFPADAIFNWTYADEQRSKAEWSGIESNPYAPLPQLNMFTYQLSEMVIDRVRQGIDIDGEQNEFAFDLNEFFMTDSNGHFIHDKEVDKFLDCLVSQEKFPFSTPELRNELKHTLWLLNRVDSAKALAQKLQKHDVFKEYEIILAAGDGKLSNEDKENEKSYNKVIKAIQTHPKTITLSVGQLTTGVTIPQWTAVLMLSSIQSPALYMQAAFRAQNPWVFQEGIKGFKRKENAYVFDFDPARTLILFEHFANDLSSSTSNGKGNQEDREKNIKELLNFFPVYGEDSEGKMIELDASKVLSIPRRIKSTEVVKAGFMCNYLFQNITNVFSSFSAVKDILQKLPSVEEQKQKKNKEIKEPDVNLDEDGNIELSDEYIIGQANDLFGDKVYAYNPEDAEDTLNKAFDTSDKTEIDKAFTTIRKEVDDKVIKPIIGEAKNKYKKDLRPSDQKRIRADINHKMDDKLERHKLEYDRMINVCETEYNKRKEQCKTEQEAKQLSDEYLHNRQEAMNVLSSSVIETIKEVTEEAEKSAVRITETNIQNTRKREAEGDIRDHLRGFSRTIPSFLMAYGDKNTALETFDSVIPDDVFEEVTGITIQQFRFLRDGGPYMDDGGNEHTFEGHLFDPVVFNDSIQEFLKLKDKLSNYFDEEQKEDIFDYIPPQKTNQIFTPKWVVKKMVDMLEEENPNCFCEPDKTFIDLYMKSGLYITEIIKKLYNNDEMQSLIPDDKERLRHIIEHQVYGLAPTEIIYRIATNFILGFNKDFDSIHHHFRKYDSLPAAKAGTLDKELDKLFGDSSKEGCDEQTEKGQ